MALNFPNMSRSYDAAGNRIRFWGHDGAIEVSFFLEVSALLRLCPETPNIESRILAAFDVAWDRIIAAAGKVYRPAAEEASMPWLQGTFHDPAGRPIESGGRA